MARPMLPAHLRRQFGLLAVLAAMVVALLTAATSEADAGTARGAVSVSAVVKAVPCTAGILVRACVVPNAKVERAQLSDAQPAARAMPTPTEAPATRGREVRYLVLEY